MKTALLTRLGGLGDIIILTCVAKELKKRGYVVDGCFGSPTMDTPKFLGNLDLFRKIYKYGKAPSGIDIYEEDDGDVYSIDFLKDRYDLPVDYRNSIENNTHWRDMMNGPGREWFASQNSNYVNWVDMMFAWAGIDPTTIADKDKVPIYKPEKDELDWAKSIVGDKEEQRTIAIQTTASSLVRTWYSPQRLPQAIIEEWPEKKVSIIIFDGNTWHLLRNRTQFPILIPKQFDPVRASAALVANCKVFIGSDSGFSHVAEAVGTHSLTIYTTVPAWTRLKYYEKAVAIEPIGDVFDNVHCHPCFTLDRFCPRIRERALKELTERELKIKATLEGGGNIPQLAQELGTTPQGVEKEAMMLQERYGALLEQQAPCTETITTDRIMDAIRELI